jgi:hypothetical protein
MMKISAITLKGLKFSSLITIKQTYKCKFEWSLNFTFISIYLKNSLFLFSAVLKSRYYKNLMLKPFYVAPFLFNKYLF